MALERIIVGLPFVGGLDTKTNEHVLSPERLSVLDNGEFTQHGKVRARPGFQSFADATVSGTLINGVASPAPVGTKLGLGTRGSELLLMTDERLYSADEGTGRWIHRGQYFPVTHTLTELGHVNAAQSYPSVATNNGVTAAIWEDSRGGVRYSVYNETTGAAYVQDVLIATGASRPYAVLLGQDILLLWVDHTNDQIHGLLIRSSDPLGSIASGSQSYLDDISSTRKYAVAVDGEELYISYHSDGTVISAGVGLAKITAFGDTRWKVSVSTDTPTCLDVAYKADGDLVSTAWYNGADIMHRTYTPSTGVATGVASSRETMANVVKIALGPSESFSAEFAIAWEVSAASVDLHSVYIDTSDIQEHVRHAHLVSSGFQLKATGGCFFLLGHDSRTGLQNAYYLYSDAALMSGQLLYQTAGDRETADHLVRVAGLECGLSFKRKLDAEGAAAVFTHKGIMRTVLDAAPAPTFAEAGGTAYLSGSCLWAYDGQGVAEANLLMYPDMVASTDIASANSTGGLTNAAQYSYRVYYEARRSNGERIRSSALTISKTLGASDDTVTLTIPTLAFTRWRDDLNADESLLDLCISIYRNEANTEVGLYYKVSSDNPATVTGSNRFVYNDPTADTVTFVDELTDSAILSREVDYLSRGEVEHIAPPGPALVATVGDRIFLAGGGVPKCTLRFSKLRFYGEPAEFSDLLVVDDLPEIGGAITALSYINETTVVFRENGINVVLGVGLDNTGSSGGFESQAVTADLGCAGAAVVVPSGVMFHSTKGIYLLGQDFGLQYVGAAVERYNSQSFSGAVVIPGTNQILFVTPDDGNPDRSLMFDYHFNEWSGWTVRAAAVVPWNGTIAYLRSADSKVLYRDPDSYLDDGNTYDLKLRTGPVRLAETVQGFGRLRRFQVLGTYRTAHTLNVGIYYDREETPYEIVQWDPTEVVSTTVWGEVSVWGGSDYWGGSLNGNTYQFEHRPKRQKFSTLRFEFSMTPGDNPGAGYELTELGLDLALKTGLQKFGSTRKH